MELRMTSKGIRIKDISSNNVVSVELSDILKEIIDGNSLCWSILYIDALERLGGIRGSLTYEVLERECNQSEKGFSINWSDLNELSKEFNQIIDIILVGCRDINLIKRYEVDQEMYESCDIYIEMHDSCFWEVFSNDESLINRLVAKFKDVISLETDFGK